jgi:hypothetical protein
MGEVGRVPVFGHITLRCHCEPGRTWQSGLLTLLSLRGRSQRELTWQSSLRRDAGVAGAMRELPNGSAGLPCRGFAPPRNDNGESGGRYGLSQFSSALFCRLVRDSLTSEPL